MTDILIYGIVGDSWDGLSANTLVPMITEGTDELNIRINSPGGFVMEGLAIYNGIIRAKSAGRKVTTFNDGLAASMASVLLMAGDEIVSAENALMMIHNPWNVAIGDATELRKEADKLDMLRDQLVNIYSKQTGLERDELVAMLDAETWLTAEQALEQKFLTSIAAASTVAACDVTAFGFRKAPESPRISALAMFGKPRAAAAVIKPKETPMPEGKTAAEIQAENEKSKAPVLTQAQVDAATTTAAANATAEERTRVSAIRALATKHKIEAAVTDKLIADGVALDVARETILDTLATRTDGYEIGGNARIVVGADERQKWIDGAAAWVMTRAGVAGTVARAAKERGETININPGEFRGVSMVDLARESLEMAGIKVTSRNPREIVAQAFTARNAITQGTGDFTVLLENTLRKTLQASYAITPDTWSRFCGIGTLTDFRPHGRYLKGSFGVLDTVAENAEFKQKPIPDGAKETITGTTKGNIIALSRQAIINDDLSAFSDLAMDLGRAAKLTIEADVYALLNSNPVMNDGVALFHASHNNLKASGAAPTPTEIDAMRQLMATQKDVSGNDYLDIRPSIFLGPLTTGSQARISNGSQYDPEAASKLQRMNIALGIFTDIVDTPRLTGTAWYTFADPGIAPAIEVAFLNGEQEPFLDSEQGWNIDGTEWKVREDYGVGAVNWRTANKNAGA